MTLTAEGTPEEGDWVVRQGGVAPPAARRLAPGERRELKLARLKQLMDRSLSESDSDANPAHRPPITEEEERKLPPVTSDPEATEAELQDQKATSPKSALKSPSSRRKPPHSLKLRVTFHESPAPQEAEPAKVHHGKERTPAGTSDSKRPFGAFRSIMETLSGNINNHNNNNNNSSQSAVSSTSCPSSPGRKSSPSGGGRLRLKLATFELQPSAGPPLDPLSGSHDNVSRMSRFHGSGPVTVHITSLFGYHGYNITDQYFSIRFFSSL